MHLRKGLTALGGAAIIGVLAVAHHTGMIDIPAPEESPSEASGDSSPETALDQLDELLIQDEHEDGYDRSLFPHWDSGVEGTCTTRQVVLKHQGEDVQTGDDCQPVSGTWTSTYDNETFTDPGEVDIDHLVALGEAWRSGAHAWTTQERQQFANDLDSPQLWAVSASSNRSKGDADPADWMPPNQDVHCEYVTAWIEVKHTWDLTVDPDEEQALHQTLQKC